MKVFKVVPRSLLVRAMTCGTLGLLGMHMVGCGGQEQLLMDRIEDLEKRLREAERHQGRQGVRLEDMEEQLALIGDRVESNRLTLERRGSVAPLPVIVERPDGTSSPAPLARSVDPVPSPSRYSAAPSMAADDGVRVRITVPSPHENIPLYQEPDTLPPMDDGPYDAAPAPAGDGETLYVDNAYLEENFGGGGGGDDEESYRPRRRAAGVSRPRAKDPVVTGERLDVVPTVPDGGSGGMAPVSSNKPMDVYKSGLAMYRAGSYQDAYREFARYLDMGPTADYLDNAYYWLGECSFGMGNYTQAVSYFDKVLRETPNGNKVPDAMLKASLAYANLGKTSEAKQILYNLLETYPNTNAARLASKKLTKLE